MLTHLLCEKLLKMFMEKHECHNFKLNMWYLILSFQCKGGALSCG